jgi:hypothetical protein
MIERSLRENGEFPGIEDGSFKKDDI